MTRDPASSPGGDVQALLGCDECIAAVETAFRLHAEGRSLAPGVLGVRAPARADSTSRPRASTSAASISRPRPTRTSRTTRARHGLPAIQGVVVLCDADDGRPLAVMDSIEVTIRRTAAATAVAARWLARPDAADGDDLRLRNPGSRTAARAHPRPAPPARLRVRRRRGRRAGLCRRACSAELGIEVKPVTDHAGGGTRGQRRLRHLHAVAQAASSGGRTFGPAPSWPRWAPTARTSRSWTRTCMAAGVVVTDVLEQCATIGDLHHALEAGAMTRDDVHAELAERRDRRRSRTPFTGGDHDLRLHGDGAPGRGRGGGRLREGGGRGRRAARGARRRVTRGRR